MKILVISGFLGAGKTTFIKELARRTKQDFAVMENEYGAVGVDGGLLKGSGDGSAPPLNVWELTEGCICCTRKADFATSVLTIANTLDPEYLVVEPTGVGMLSKILDNIKTIEYERISLLSPITVLDGENFFRSMEEFPDTLKDQLEAAGTVVISKQEHGEEKELRELEERILAVNPSARVCSRHYTKMEADWWEELLRRPLNENSAVPVREETEELENLGLTSVSLRSENELILFLQGVVSGVFGDICRAKGYLKAGDAWLRFDVVENTYSVTGFTAAEEAKAVFIGRKLRRNLLREALLKELYVKPGGFAPVRRAGRPEGGRRRMENAVRKRK